MGRVSETIVVGDVMLELTSQDKVMFPEDGITKGELVSYYLEVASYMLPHLEGRPLTVRRFNAGIDKYGFVQKQAGEHYPDWIPRVTVTKSDGGETDYPLVEDAAGLAYLANLNAVEFHVVAVRAEHLEKPDMLVMDLDPSPLDKDFEKVRRAAHVMADELVAIGLEPFLKTSGSSGLHVVAPILPEDDVEAVSALGKRLAAQVVRRAPDILSTEISKERRGNRVFVDYLRNGPRQTLAAPYSVRALPKAPVSTPLEWSELDDPGLHARRWTLRNVRARLQARGDPWQEIRRAERSLLAARASFVD